MSITNNDTSPKEPGCVAFTVDIPAPAVFVFFLLFDFAVFLVFVVFLFLLLFAFLVVFCSFSDFFAVFLFLL